VQPWENVDRARAPDGTELVLARRGDEWVVREAGRVLMSSRVHGSEEALAAFALERVQNPRTVLIGGLGLGFTLRATLDRLGPDTRVILAEMVPELVGWNRGPVADLAGRPLEDPRVRLQIGDVRARIAEAHSAYDAILLDVDNGPSALNHVDNAGLYSVKGIHACRDALRAGGALAVWAAGSDEAYAERLERAGFDVQVRVVPARGSGQGGVRHVVFVATRPAARAARPPARSSSAARSTSAARSSSATRSPADARSAHASRSPDPARPQKRRRGR
jgi:spermidine synthase